MHIANMVNHERTVLNLPHGTRMELLSPAGECAYCVMTAAIPPGVSVPLHSHSDAETFYMLAGEADGDNGRTGEAETRAGRIHSYSGGAKHAWRNRSSEPIAALVIGTATLGRALREMAQVAAALDPIQRLAEISQRYQYWFGSPEENAAAGIVLG